MNLAEKNILVTGANGGLGFALASELIKQGPNLFISCRTLSQADATKARLLKVMPHANIIALAIDMNDLHECFNMVQNLPNFDLVINNAGVHIGKYAPRIRSGQTKINTNQGFEINFQVNYLAPVLIAETCMHKLNKNAKIIHVFSKDYTAVRQLDLSNVSSKKLSASGHYEYARSKLCLALYQQLCLHMSPNISSFIASPGVTSTALWDNVPKIIKWFRRKEFHAPESGAVPILKCLEIQQPEFGIFLGYSNNQNGWCVEELNGLATNFQLQQQLWQQTKTWFASMNLPLYHQ